MNAAIVATLLLYAIPPTAIDTTLRSGATIFECDFEGEWDKNYDKMPDGWRRRAGIGFPAYIPISLAEADCPSGKVCLEMEMQGGGAVVYSPDIPVDQYHDYVAGVFVNVEGLKNDRAFLSLTFFDQGGARLETVVSEKIVRTNGWTLLKVGPVVPSDPTAATATIGLHVEPTKWEDLEATVYWDDAWMIQLPHISLSLNKRLHFFTDPSGVRVFCEASGFAQDNPRVLFRMEDAEGVVLGEAERSLRAKTVASTFGGLRDGFQSARHGEVDWIPPIGGPGFYRVLATIQGDSQEEHEAELDFVVIEPTPKESEGRFGVSIPGGGAPLTRPELAYVISQLGVHYVKYPLWFGEGDKPEDVQQIVRFCERMGIHGVRVVGLLDEPPPDLRDKIPHTDMTTAEVFGSPMDVWSPSLENVVMRMATQVQWWQLGRDEDMSLIGYPGLEDRMTRIKDRLDRVGFDVKLGFAWNWMYPYPVAQADPPPWRAMTLSMSPPMTPEELRAYMEGSPETPQEQWVLLRPLSRAVYDSKTRVIDMVRRMIEAQVRQADAVFVPTLLSSDHGLLNDDGTPSALFLPWRTTALHLAGGKHGGSLVLPSRSPNMVFDRGKLGGVIVVWNEQPTTEVLYVGRDAKHVNLWGSSIEPKMVGGRQLFEVGPYPSFIVGADMDIVRWRQDFRLQHEHIPSVFGRKHPNAFTFKNGSSYGISAKATLRTPDVWKLEPMSATFVLGEGQTYKQDFEIGLPYNATSGKHPVEIEMQVQTASRTEEFSVYRDIAIGSGDIYLLVDTRLNAKGELEVRQTFVNESDKTVNFVCQLIAPGRRAARSEVMGLGQGRKEYTYYLPDGESLLGKTLWIRAQEVGGVRTLNQKFEAKRSAQ